MVYKDYCKLFQQVTGSFHFQGKVWRSFRSEMKNITATEIMDRYRICTEIMDRYRICNSPVVLAPSVPSCIPDNRNWGDERKETGNNPMKTTLNTTSTDISFNAGQSDAAKARDFLMSEFDNLTRYEWKDAKREVIAKLYNLNAPMIPDTSQEIIDAFKNGDILIDQKKVDNQTEYFKTRSSGNYYDDYEDGIDSRYFGVTFTKLPKEDRKGFVAAMEEYSKLKTDTKRKLAILDPEAGLEVLTAFEAWTPTLATDTAH